MEAQVARSAHVKIPWQEGACRKEGRDSTCSGREVRPDRGRGQALLKMWSFSLKALGNC